MPSWHVEISHSKMGIIVTFIAQLLVHRETQKTFGAYISYYSLKVIWGIWLTPTTIINSHIFGEGSNPPNEKVDVRFI